MATIIIYSFLLSSWIFVILLSYYLTLDVESTIMNMTLKKFQKDVKSSTFTNKLFKRYISFLKNGDSKVVEKKLVSLGVDNKDSYHISRHPIAITETVSGKTALTNLTSSQIVNGKKTILVGIQENGKSSNLVDKIFIVNCKPVEITRELYKGGIIKDLSIVNGQQTANNVGNIIENRIGEKIINKNLESIASFKEPIDKI